MTIPKVIYMCHKELTHITRYSQNWKRLNPDYEIKLFDDKLCEDFLARNFSRLHLEIFRFISDGPIKADFWRCCILYKFGGVYADADIEPLVPISEYIEPKISFLTCIAYDFNILYKNYRFNPHFIMAEKYDQNISNCITSYVNIYKNDKQNYSYWKWSICCFLMIPDVNEKKSQTIIKNGKKYQFLFQKTPDECEYNGVTVLYNSYKTYKDHNFIE